MCSGFVVFVAFVLIKATCGVMGPGPMLEMVVFCEVEV